MSLPGVFSNAGEAETDQHQSLPFVASPIVSIESNDATRTEIVQIIIAWLLQHGFTSSAQVLREEATVQLRGDHYIRKTIRAICRSVEESNWESAQKGLRKLQTKAPIKSSLRADGAPRATNLVRTLPFLFAQQQYLELIDDGNDQRAFSFFMRTIKPFEQSISREHFQKLTYLLTCKTVAESSNMYPEYQDWTSKAGRAELLQHIRNHANSPDSSSCCRQRNISIPSPNDYPRTLDTLLCQSFSYEIAAHHHPEWFSSRRKTTITSLSLPIDAQLPSTEPFLSIDVNALVRMKFPSLLSAEKRPRIRITACEPFLSYGALLAATDTGDLLWIPTISPSSGTTSSEAHLADEAQIVYHHSSSIRDLRRRGPKVFCWGGCHSVALSVESLMSSGQPSQPVQCVTNAFTHSADVYAGCLFPCATYAATGLSEGNVSLWDLSSGVQLYEHTFSNFPVVSLLSNSTGSSFFAASKDGTIRVVDVATGVMMISLTSPISMEISSVSLSPSSAFLLTSYRGGALCLWDVLTGELLPYRFLGLSNNTKARSTVSFGSHDTEIFSGGEDGCLYYWCLRDRDQMATKEAMNSETATSHAGVLFASNAKNMGYLIRPSGQLPLHRSAITDVKFEGGYEVTSGEDGVIVLCAPFTRVASGR